MFNILIIKGVQINMQSKWIKFAEAMLDEYWQLALSRDKRMGNTLDDFLPDNPNWIYYKGMIEMVQALGLDWQRNNGKHKIFK